MKKKAKEQKRRELKFWIDDLLFKQAMTAYRAFTAEQAQDLAQLEAEYNQL